MKKILFSILIGLNALLLFFLVFESRIVVPAWLHVLGRVHPLFLHFPIATVLIVAGMAMFSTASFRQNSWYTELMDIFLLASALTSSITATMGLLLSLAEGYDAESVFWHKWSGVVIPFVLFILYYYKDRIFKEKIISISTGLAITVIIVIAGHHGSVITHGENFVWAPVTEEKEKKLPSFDQAFAYADLVHPILEQKCMSCHNSKKSKGELLMDTKELLIKGGKSGKLWDNSKKSLGLLMERIHLPLEAKKHMPPSGKTQLTDEEIAVLYNWIKQGADFEKKVMDLSPSDTLFLIARKKFGTASEEIYDFAMPDEKQVARLSNNNRMVTRLALGSPALRVTFFNASLFTSSSIDELQPIRENIVDMSFENMPLADADLKMLKSFVNLRKLNLNSTAITGQSLPDLITLKSLRSLLLSGTAIQKSQLSALSGFTSLRSVYLGNTGINEDDLKALKEQHTKMVFMVGARTDTTILKLTPPILDNDKDVITVAPLEVKMKHYIKGTTIRYTLDGKDPDSLLSPEFTGSLTVSASTLVKAKAFKKGWISSDVSKHYYFKRSIEPDSVSLKYPPVSVWGGTAPSLIDKEKSDLNFASGRWAGFNKQEMDCNLYFSKPVMVSNITLSYLFDFSANVFPPEKIEVWGGPDQRRLKLLTTMNPYQPQQMEFKAILPAECNFKTTEVNLIRIIAWPLPLLPAWHQDFFKKRGSSMLVDEIFVN